MSKTNKKWIQKAVNPSKKGALHRMLGYSESKTIPVSDLTKIVNTEIGKKAFVNGKWRTVTKLLKNRANFAKNARG